MSGVPASSRSFNGGTITTPLTIAGQASEPLLTLKAVAGASSDVMIVHADAADQVDTRWVIDQHGNQFIRSGGTFQQAILQLSDNTAGNPGQVLLDTFNGVRLNPEGSGNTVLALAPRTSHTGPVVSVADKDGNSIARALATDALGFFGATPAAQPTGVAVTAAAIHAALVSLGLITA